MEGFRQEDFLKHESLSYFVLTLKMDPNLLSILLQSFAFLHGIFLCSRKRNRTEQDLKWSISSFLVSLFSDLFLCSLLFLSGQSLFSHSVSLDVFLYLSHGLASLPFSYFSLYPCVSFHFIFISSE